jgi:RNA polymerase sigma-70 factor (ECF subfamily)
MRHEGIEPMTDREREAAFAALYRDNFGRVLRFVARRVGDVHDAEDLTCEVFAVAWARTRAGTPVSAPWLFVTARNMLANHRRAARRLATADRVSIPDPATPPDHRVGDPVGQDVRNVMAGLPEQHREVLMLRYWDEFNGREMASFLGVSPPAVWVRLHRARRAFAAEYRKVPRSDHG